ncbi:tetracycline resistance efflux system leader peptide [Acinetobacter sp. NIOH-H-8]
MQTEPCKSCNRVQL